MKKVCDMVDECALVYTKLMGVDCPLDESDYENCPYYRRLISIYNRAIIAAINACVYPLDEKNVRALMRVV